VTLSMADGPVANLPPGMDAYGGYVNASGIGITYPGVVARFPSALHLSFTTDGAAALCADVESGAMSGWTNYPYGYCSVSRVNALIRVYGRPKKLITAHYDPAIGKHICSPKCTPDLVTTADGTQWIDHGGWDESVLADDFFILSPIPVPSKEAGNMLCTDPNTKGSWALAPDGGVDTADGSLEFGSMAGNRWNWQAVGSLNGITPCYFPSMPSHNGGWGYKVCVLLKSGKAADGGVFDYYRFPPDGSLMGAHVATALDLRFEERVAA
jgi:hypothetical protein